MIGDCHGSALVARDGSIDWACLGRFDADPVFCGLLNGDAGGRLETRPADRFETTRAYLADTNIAYSSSTRCRYSATAVLFAAALTTLGGVWSAMTAMVAADFGWLGARAVRTQRFLLLAVATVSWLGAVLLVDDILNRLILANVPVAGLAFALLAGFHWPRATTAGAWASTVVGVCWGAGAFLVVGESGGYTWTWAIYGIPLIFVTGVVVSLANRRGAASGDAQPSLETEIR